ncbi:MAG: MscL family protein [Candidatus Nomurabacteria bacterium]
MVKELGKFLKEKGVIGAAVGIIIGYEFQAFVKAVVGDIVSPVISYFFGQNGNIQNMSFTMENTNITFRYGDLLSETINFIAILIVVYFVFIKSPIKRLDDKN